MNASACGGSTQSVHAAARAAKRRPPSATIQPGPIRCFENLSQISPGLTLNTSHTKSAVPAIAMSAPVGVIWRSRGVVRHAAII